MLAGRVPATIVCEDQDAVAFMDLRQFHPGHALVIPRAHVGDIRDADEETAVAHPRRIGDGLLAIYPRSPDHPDRATLESWGARIREALP